jgi:predicted enzyme related to lactoylglutathione lyase
MTEGIKLFVYPVTDMARAKTLYSRLLGTETYADAPYYAGFKVGDQEIGLDPNDHKQGQTGPLGYFEVDDINESVQSLLEAGAQVNQDVKDVGGGKLIASVKDANGNVIALVQSP